MANTKNKTARDERADIPALVVEAAAKAARAEILARVARDDDALIRARTLGDEAKLLAAEMVSGPVPGWQLEVAERTIAAADDILREAEAAAGKARRAA